LLFGIFTATPDRVGTPLVRFVGYEVLTSVVVVFAILATAVFFASYSDDRVPEPSSSSPPSSRRAFR